MRTFAPDAILLLVGGGEDYTGLQAMAGQMGLADSVRFVGRVPPQDVPAYYRLAKASVDPVRDDAAARARSPLKLFESWASGVPFVSADVGDRRRLVGDPPAGLLAAPGDPESLAEALLSVLFNNPLAEALTQRGLSRVQSYYWDQLARRMQAEYQRQEPERA